MKDPDTKTFIVLSSVKVWELDFRIWISVCIQPMEIARDSSESETKTLMVFE